MCALHKDFTQLLALCKSHLVGYNLHFKWAWLLTIILQAGEREFVFVQHYLPGNLNGISFVHTFDVRCSIGRAFCPQAYYILRLR